MAETAITIHIDHKIASELLTKINRHLGGKQDRQRVIAIHVEDWDLNHFGDVGRIHR